MLTRRSQRPNHYQDSSKRKYIIAGAVCFVAVLGVAGILIYGVVTKNTANAEKPAVTNDVPSPFSYKAVGNWGGALEDGQSLGLFGKKDAQGISPCFVSANYTLGSVNGATRKESFIEDGASKVINLGAKTMTMKMDEGVKHYALDQFDVQSPAGENHLMEGQEYGYIQMSKGGVTVMGNCEQLNLLPTTTDVLPGLSFDSTKVTMMNCPKP